MKTFGSGFTNPSHGPLGKLDDAALGCMSGVIIAAGGNVCMIGTRFLLSCTTKK
jgi:hypothetical protein